MCFERVVLKIILWSSFTSQSGHSPVSLERGAMAFVRSHWGLFTVQSTPHNGG